jgi:integrase
MASSPGSANNCLKALQGLFAYAVDQDLLKTSPTAGVKKLPVKTERAGGSRAWLQEHADLFRARWPLGTPQRTLFEIMWNTALRIGDALRLGPQHTRDGRVRMSTNKKGEGIDLPLLPELVEALAAYTWFSAAARRAGLPPRYTAHGCRKGLLTKRAQARATPHEQGGDRWT